MTTLRDLLPTRLGMPPAQRPLLAFAAIVAVSLLSFYVHLLHESMALGEQMRERQRSSANQETTKLTLQRPASRLGPNAANTRGR